QTHLPWLLLAALTADGLAALTLGGEMMGLGEGCRKKGLLRGDLDLDIAYEALLGRVLENFGLTALTVLAAVVFLVLLKPFEGECVLSGTGGATDIGGRCQTKMPRRFDKLRRLSKTRNILGYLRHIFLLRVRNLILNDGGTRSRRLPSISFMRPFGCPVTILNTLDPLGKFQEKVDEGFLLRYSVCSKAFRVFNSRTRIVQETLHVNFMENKPNVAGSGPAWLFDIDSLSQTMNYHPVLVENQTNYNAGFQDTKKAEEEGTQTYVLFPILSDGSINPKNNKDAHTDGKEHDDIQKSVSPDIYSSSCGDLTRE
nr:retrovirus-related Pol polyprotein from transposon TNT 1-94 [Tanacetum cinerariifolium]